MYIHIKSLAIEMQVPYSFMNICRKILCVAERISQIMLMRNNTYCCYKWIGMNIFHLSLLFFLRNERKRILSLLPNKDLDFVNSWEKFYNFTLVSLRSTRAQTKFLTLVEEISDIYTALVQEPINLFI